MFTVGEKVILNDEQHFYYGFPGEIVRVHSEEWYGVRVTIPKDQQQEAEEGNGHVLKGFTGRFHVSELISLKDS